MDLTAWNNEAMTVALDVSAAVVLGGDADADWRLQARRVAPSADLYLDIAANGFAAGVVSFLAPAATMARLAGQYQWDCGFRPAAGGDFVRLVGGTLTVETGVTRVGA